MKAISGQDKGDGFVKSYIMPLRGTITENNLSIISKGYDILKPIEFPWPVAKIVLQHHERMEGSGYPQGLSSEDILPEARSRCC